MGLLLSASHSGMYVADAKGFFEEQGIEIETTKGS
ncbi:MAG TPA: ABC transporter substrate-binding protein [Chloroflexota bacterium]